MSSPTAWIVSQPLFKDGPPLKVFREMRETSPVHWNASASGTGFWSLTRYEMQQRDSVAQRLHS